MKALNFFTIPQKIIVGFLATTLAIMFTSCSKKTPFLTSSVVPAARGYVKVDRDKNQNYSVHLEVTSLAEVTRLTPPKKVYVVWMDADQSSSKNIGKIDSSTKAFSKSLKASFESTSSTKPTKVFITAEDDASVQYPNGQVVLTTSGF